MMFCIVLIFSLNVVSSVFADRPTCHNRGQYEIIAKSDCTGYYICVNMMPVEMPNCPTGSVFSSNAHVCVPKGSMYDDCNQGPEVLKPDGRPPLPDLGPLSIDEQCRMHGGLIPHPDECQAYYNCSNEEDPTPRYLEKYMMECPYPQLFNADTLTCEHFENVVCGKRTEFKNGCDYRRNQCPVAHCIPCYVLYPSCEGRNNGMNPHEAKLWSPYYVMCYAERMVKDGICPKDNNGRTQLFHPDLNECVSLDMIPKEHGGMMPDCSGRPDGFYPDDFGRCGQYTVCKEGHFQNNVRCRTGEVYDAVYEDCQKEEEACGACGKNPNC